MTVTMEVAKVCIQSSVLCSIFHQYQRRSDSCSTRLVGALVGRASTLEDNFTGGSKFGIEFTNCFPVPHSEVGEEISINSEYFRSRLELHKKSHGKDRVFLGWYSMQDANGLPKNTNAAAFLKNSEFIRDYFVREASLSGAPIVANLTVTLASDGHLTYEVACGETPKMVHHAGLKPQFAPVSIEIGYGMPELQAGKNVPGLCSHSQFCGLVNFVTRSLLGSRQALEFGDSSLLPLDNATSQSLRHRELLLEEVRALESSENAASPQKVESVLKALGRSANVQAEYKLFVEDDEALKESLASLDEKLAQTRAVFIPRPFTSL